MKRLFLKRAFLKNGPPIHLIWFLTGRCNLQCLHCFCHKQNASAELSFEEIKKTVNNLSPLLSATLTGGEVFLRDDLVEVAKLFPENNVTDNLVLFTNGFLPDKIISSTEKILSACPDTTVSIGVSLDGFEQEHDTYRNKKGSYARALETIEGFNKLRKHFPKFFPGIGITLHAGNVAIIDQLRKYIYDRFGIRAGIIVIRGDVRINDLKKIDVAAYKRIIDTLQKERLSQGKTSAYQTIINTRTRIGHALAYETLLRGKRLYDCYAGSLMAAIYENGDVFPCEMLPQHKIGNLRETNYNLSTIWQSGRGNEVRKFIKTKHCACTYECQYTCNTLYNIKFYPSFLKDLIKNCYDK